MLLRRMNIQVATVHGFRSAFRDWAAECTNFSNEVCEAALAHAVENKVEAAYRRGDLFDKRRKLMEAWAAYCASTTAAATAKVVPIREAVVVTNRPVGAFSHLVGVAVGSWREVFNYFAGVPDAKPTAADYAFSVRKLYEMLVGAEAVQVQDDDLRECLLLLVWQQLRAGVISKQHYRQVDKLLPKANATPLDGRGRPKGAYGKAAHTKRYQLYKDWIREEALNPSLTKEEFVKKHLGITDVEFDADFDPRRS